MEFQNMQKEMENPDRIEREMVSFTDEEGYGRFLDLHTLYNEYVNMKHIKVSFFNNLVFSSFRRLTISPILD